MTSTEPTWYKCILDQEFPLVVRDGSQMVLCAAAVTVTALSRGLILVLSL